MSKGIPNYLKPIKLQFPRYIKYEHIWLLLCMFEALLIKTIILAELESVVMNIHLAIRRNQQIFHICFWSRVAGNLVQSHWIPSLPHHYKMIWNVYRNEGYKEILQQYIIRCFIIIIVLVLNTFLFVRSWISTTYYILNSIIRNIAWTNSLSYWALHNVVQFNKVNYRASQQYWWVKFTQDLLITQNKFL